MDLSAAVRSSPSGQTPPCNVISYDPVVTKASNALSLNIQLLITENQEVWMMVSGMKLLPSGSSSGLTFDGPLSHTMTLSGCGDDLALSQVKWIQGELFVFPSKNKEGFLHHVDVSLSPISS